MIVRIAGQRLPVERFRVIQAALILDDSTEVIECHGNFDVGSPQAVSEQLQGLAVHRFCLGKFTPGTQGRCEAGQSPADLRASLSQNAAVAGQGLPVQALGLVVSSGGIDQIGEVR